MSPIAAPRVRLLLLLVATAAAACAGSAPHPPVFGELQGSWQLASAAPPGGRIPTLNIDGDGSISGNGGVNRFRGRLDAKALDDGHWRAGSIRGTRMAGTAEAMQLEGGFLQALVEADRAVLDGDLLHLRRGDQELLTLARLRLP